MARRTRMYIPGYAYHIVQRGNNRQPCFFERENYFVYKKYLGEVLPRYGVSLHTYCLMTNHIHLLITPNTTTGISDLMKVVNSRYAQYVNRKYDRTGSLWEGRHRSSAVDSEQYLLRCYCYIELNPLRARMVRSAVDYPWSSIHANAYGLDDSIVERHECFERLGKTPELRRERYRAALDSLLTEEDIEAFREAARSSMPIGSSEFSLKIQDELGHSIGSSKRGRPAAN